MFFTAGCDQTFIYSKSNNCREAAFDQLTFSKKQAQSNHARIPARVNEKEKGS
jgi:hypothetical protein